MFSAAQEKIDTYCAAMKEKHDAECDPLNMQLDTPLIYDEFGRLSHGRVGFMDSLLPHDTLRGQARAHRQQAASSSCAQVETQKKLIEELQAQRQADEARWRAEEQRWKAQHEAEEQRRRAEREEGLKRLEAIQNQNYMMYQFMYQRF